MTYCQNLTQCLWMNGNNTTEFSRLMTRAGLGIGEAASVLGVHDRTVRRYMKGETRRIAPWQRGRGATGSSVRAATGTCGPE